MGTKCIQTHLEHILHYLDPYWNWLNCHMVNYFTNNHWEKHIPIELQQEFHNCSIVNGFIENITSQMTSSNTSVGSKNCTGEFEAFAKFYRQTQNHCLSSLPNTILLTLIEWQQLYGIEQAIEPIKIKEFLSAKKKHEVELSAQLVHNMLFHSPINDVYIVDAGDGKGYLSSRLALEYGYKVLGIDSNNTNSINALERNRKLQRFWKSLKLQATIANEGNNTMMDELLNRESYEKSNTENTPRYKTTSQFITNHLDFPKVLQQHFPEFNQQDICITGLHTCGNLSPTCLQAFHSQASCKYLFNIGCCYHLLTEHQNNTSEFLIESNNKSYNNNYKMLAPDFDGFPMSEYLQKKQFRLGRNARMLATQSLDRLFAGKMLPNASLYYRALLEVLIVESNKNCDINDGLRQIQIGKLRNYGNFTEYIERCKEKFPFVEFEISKESIKSVEERYADQRPYLELFYILRMQFAPVIETLILLDRLLYLKELNYNDSYLIALFDPIISPRSYAIVARK